MNKYLNEREQKIFVICITTVFLAVVYNYLFVPLQNKKSALDEEILIHQKLYDQNNMIIQKGIVANDQYEYYSKQFYKFGAEEEVVSSILSDIEQITGQIGLHIAELKPSKVQQNEIGNYLSVSLTIKAELVDIVHFLYTIQQPPSSVSVEKIEFEQSARKGQKMITTHLTLGKIFILSDAVEIQESVTRSIHQKSHENNHNIDHFVVQRKPFRIYEEDIKARNLFQPLGFKTKTNTIALQKALPALHKRIKLIGILLDNDSRAIVEDLLEKQTHFLSQGESVGTVLLEDIQEDKVIFNDGGRFIELTL